MQASNTVSIIRKDIEIHNDQDGKPQLISMHTLAYPADREFAVTDNDIELWELDLSISDDWVNHDTFDVWSGMPYGICTYVGLDNQELINHILNSLMTEESITLKYSVEIEISPGHALKMCGSCKYYEDGWCSNNKDEVSATNLSPCYNK